jgi:hypothetical protein
MISRDLRCSRRKFLASTAALTLGGAGVSAGPSASIDSANRRPIAVLGSVYRPLSYLYHLAGRFLHGCTIDGQPWMPQHRIASLWLDQTPENDLSREIARKFGILRARTIRDALVVDGQLAVNGVLIVAEHGNYPRNEFGQILYPRAPIFDEVIKAFRAVGQTAPIFIAKHLSYSLAQAGEMIESSRDLLLRVAAGSAVTTARREPPVDLTDQRISEGLVAAFGPLEVSGFDALQALQCLIEKRDTGEPAVKVVRCLSGAEVWRAGDRGDWSWDLLHAALARAQNVNLGDPRDNVGSIAMPAMPATPPLAIQVEFADGVRGTVLLLNGHLQDFVGAARTADDVVHACRFDVGSAPGMSHFNEHAAAIDEFLIGGNRLPLFQLAHSALWLGRTLMTTDILERAMQSHSLRGRPIHAPNL